MPAHADGFWVLWPLEVQDSCSVLGHNDTVPAQLQITHDKVKTMACSSRMICKDSVPSMQDAGPSSVKCMILEKIASDYSGALQRAQLTGCGVVVHLAIILGPAHKMILMLGTNSVHLMPL